MFDVLGGSAVRAVACNRADYRPLSGGAEPWERFRQLRQSFNCNQLYLADLDAIVYQHPQPKLWQDLAACCE
ncbi:MAG: nickel transporter, partial [Planctomyces sp.]